MNQNNRFCKIKGHEEYPVFHICTLIECNQISRWSCVECVQKGIHNHNKSNNSHIMNRKEILNELMTKYEKFNDLSDKHISSTSNLLEKILNECQSLEKILIDYMKQIEKHIQCVTSDEDQARFQQYLGYLYDNSFLELDDDKINQLINFSKQQINQNKQIILQQPLDKIQQQLKQLETVVKEYQDHQIGNSITDIKNRKYLIEQIDQGNNYFHASSISSNCQYLSYGADNKKSLKIYDIQQKKIYKEIQLDSSFRVCQFSKDSSQLYVGLESGFVYGYDAQKDYKEIYKQQIHSSHVYNIIIINNEFLLTCSADKSIIKTNIQNQQQIIKLIGHTSWIIGIIVSASNDKSIKLWNCGKKSIIINKAQSHNISIRQIQFINNNSNILSLDQDGNLYKWNIDFLNKDLIKLQSFSDENKIFNFSQVLQNQYLLIICNKYIKILNQQGETQNTIQHNGGLSNIFVLMIDPLTFDCRQLDNLKYIQIIADSKIIFINRENHFSHCIRLRNNITQNKLIYNQLQNRTESTEDIYTLAQQLIQIVIMRMKVI